MQAGASGGLTCPTGISIPLCCLQQEPRWLLSYIFGNWKEVGWAGSKQLGTHSTFSKSFACFSYIMRYRTQSAEHKTTGEKESCHCSVGQRGKRKVEGDTLFLSPNPTSSQDQILRCRQEPPKILPRGWQIPPNPPAKCQSRQPSSSVLPVSPGPCTIRVGKTFPLPPPPPSAPYKAGQKFYPSTVNYNTWFKIILQAINTNGGFGRIL